MEVEKSPDLQSREPRSAKLENQESRWCTVRVLEPESHRPFEDRRTGKALLPSPKSKKAPKPGAPV